MATVGILTEKPSAARKFAQALGGVRGSYQGEDYVISHARGHLFELASPEAMVPVDLKEKYKSWSLETLPWDPADIDWSYVQRPDVAQLVSQIKRDLGSCDEVVIATDVDPSGEGFLLAYLVIRELGLSPRKFSRMVFTDEEAPSLQKAFTNRQDVPVLEQHPEFLMADVRNRFDALSMQFTRVATVIAGQYGTVLRQGRLKSFMVRRVFEQLEAYNSYKKVPFYSNRFRDENGVVYTNPEEPQFATSGEVPQNYSPSAVVLDSRENKRTTPPRLLDLSSLASVLSKRNFKAKLVADTYQKMYEAGVVSYPRTEDKTVTTEQFNELLPKVDQIAGVLGVDPGLLTVRSPRRTHVKDAGAHGANRPGPNVPSSLEEVEQVYGKVGRAIYEVLGRNYLAMHAEDYCYEQQKGHVADYPAFVGSVNIPQSLGYKAVFDADGDDEEEAEGTKGLGQKADPFVHEGFPPRPPRPTMTWLMKELVKHDVGTGATRTSTYAEVTNAKARNALLNEGRGGALDVTDAGRMSALLLPNTNIARLDLTTWLTSQMKAVSRGETTAQVVLDHVGEWVTQDIETMKENSVTMFEQTGVSPQQSGPPKEKFSGTFEGREVTFSREFSSYRFSDQECLDLLEGKEIPFTFTAASGKLCSVIGSLGDQVNPTSGKSYFGVGVEFVQSVPDQWAKHVFTDAEKSRLEAGESVEINDAVFKSGPARGPVSVRYGVEPGSDRKKIIPAFADPEKADEPPASWAQHVFTEAEKKLLVDGQPVEITDAKKRDGNPMKPVKVWWENETPTDTRKRIVPEFARNKGEAKSAGKGGSRGRKRS